MELEPDTLPATDIQAESDGQLHPDSLPEPSVKRRVAMMLGFVIVSVVLLTLAAGGVAAVGHTAAHLFPSIGGCGGG